MRKYYICQVCSHQENAMSRIITHMLVKHVVAFPGRLSNQDLIDRTPYNRDWKGRIIG